MDMKFFLLLVVLLCNLFLAILYRGDRLVLALSLISTVICAVILFVL